ncbi:hypothetical protein QFZ75_007935 [Streptomyces sp. V3I8]|uniref:WhiB family transcriptional regulator n=1 Tax=Streptomyces sp. V3I8 TaxID=3042279 RepID=UPI00278213FB|nr:WhiB family transcriptional regulator [Streptomyces sp. V3I8]MDQ1041433.1 hypothetical protein [Streptomyces sp. V3I8]
MTFPCSTDPRLFDAGGGPDDPDVQKAKAICFTCPAIFMCRQQGRDGRENGVWGGESQVERVGVVGMGEDAAECGTYAGLMLHRALLETCETCLAARRERERDYNEKRKAGKKLVDIKPRGGVRTKSECPSVAAYKRHMKNDEDPGPCGCRGAYNAARKAERAAKPKGPRKVQGCPSTAAYRRHHRNGESGIECGCRAFKLGKDAKAREEKKQKAGAA